jgi:allophanate hydrolase
MPSQRTVFDSTAAVGVGLATLAGQYRAGRRRPSDVVRDIHARMAQHSDNPIWLHVVPEQDALARAHALESDPAASARPLYGVPFAVKDNIDVAGLPTTAACPAFSYIASRTATAVQRLLDAGAILVGKTNLDQFATGLVGTRSPYGAVRNAFDPAYISGGSSSGSAVAVALGMASFALGTDTAGSGRVPAAFNNLVGLKPTRGLVSTSGVVPACRSLDCLSVFAHTARDARAVLDVIDAFDQDDAFARLDRAPRPLPARPRVGVPVPGSLDVEGDADSARLFDAAVAHARAMGWTIVDVDIAPFLETAALLYGGPWVAERYAAIRELIEQRPQAMLPVIREIIGEATRYSAADAFEASYRLAALRRAADRAWRDVDVLLLPTAPTHYTRAQVEADPIGTNARLGRFTNFVNLLDLAAIALPAGFRPNGLPFGITFVAPAGTDRALCARGERWQQALASQVGTADATRALEAAVPADPTGATEVALAVVGAHLSGQPLNGQLTDRGARLLRTCRTAAAYRLYALPGTTPPKPGLLRTGAGAAIEVEVWSMPVAQLGAFVAAVPAPLGIGTVDLDDGTRVLGFLCESYALEGARDISAFGGWRSYLASLTSVHAQPRERP